MPRPGATPERSGRPRDPEVDRRVLDAAVDVFARTGWAGFSIDAVARAASVGKASIYLRWSGKEALLTEAVGSAFAPISTIDSGSVRDDLLALAHLLLELYDGPTGLAARRMVVESEATPGLADHWSEVRAAQVRATRGIVRRAVRRGELPAGTSVTLVVDTLCGAAMLRSVAVPAHLRDTAGRARSRYARELVDFVLAAATRG